MKEFKGYELTKIESEKQNFYLVFHTGDHPSEDISFDSEEECDQALADVLKGNGLKVKYDFNRKEVTVFPHSIMKIKTIGCWGLPDSAIDDFRGMQLTPDVLFPPKHIGHNEYQPERSHE